MMLSETYQRINSSIVSKGAMNSFKEIFPLARIFPLAVMHMVQDLITENPFSL